ncbi:MAG: helix-turn-helix domain-containing protein [Chitinivibrionales bacterium]|nr:helix-turn-helix domain-containing protein [Chitinivibrionales bacterium]
MVKSELSKDIRKRRKFLKISQGDLAEISGVSLRTIKAIEEGDANPTLRNVSRVLEPLGLALVTAERVQNE